ncbi:MAG TPA: hypothetical protein VLJ58_00980 [Ramlibacter sp.]|nr:hypothetical protein [Ramlibacter sp.]
MVVLPGVPLASEPVPEPGMARLVLGVEAGSSTSPLLAPMVDVDPSVLLAPEALVFIRDWQAVSATVARIAPSRAARRGKAV